MRAPIIEALTRVADSLLRDRAGRAGPGGECQARGADDRGHLGPRAMRRLQRQSDAAPRTKRARAERDGLEAQVLRGRPQSARAFRRADTPIDGRRINNCRAWRPSSWRATRDKDAVRFSQRRRSRERRGLQRVPLGDFAASDLRAAAADRASRSPAGRRRRSPHRPNT